MHALYQYTIRGPIFRIIYTIMLILLKFHDLKKSKNTHIYVYIERVFSLHISTYDWIKFSLT